MATPYLIPCLVQVRYEFNRLSPTRDKGADGWIGDTAHIAEGTKSDHNPDSLGRVLAVDIDSTGPWPVLFDLLIMSIVARCRSGRENRVEYIIWNGYIYSRIHSFDKRVYYGADQHKGHAHISARHDHSGEADTRGWNLLTFLPAPTGDDEVTKEDMEAATEQGFTNLLAGWKRAISNDPTATKTARDQVKYLRDVLAIPTAKEVAEEIVHILNTPPVQP